MTCPTDAFRNCLRRFVFRRGLCKHIHCDNGTNFVGARNELREHSNLLSANGSQRTIQDFLANKEIAWHIVPLSAPHFGGLWENATTSPQRLIIRVQFFHLIKKFINKRQVVQWALHCHH